MRYRCEILNHGIDGYEVWLHGRNQGRSGVKKYLSTSSTFISSTSTSTHIKICSKVRMDIQSRVNFR